MKLEVDRQRAREQPIGPGASATRDADAASANRKRVVLCCKAPSSFLPCIRGVPSRNNQPCHYSAIWATMPSSPLGLHSSAMPTITTTTLKPHNPLSQPLYSARPSPRNPTQLLRFSAAQHSRTSRTSSRRQHHPSSAVLLHSRLLPLLCSAHPLSNLNNSRNNNNSSSNSNLAACSALLTTTALKHSKMRVFSDNLPSSRAASSLSRLMNLSNNSPACLEPTMQTL